MSLIKNKKGIDSTLSLFFSTIVIVLIVILFSAFATLLLVERSLTFGDTEISVSSSAVNAISFLKTGNSGDKIWKVISQTETSSVAYNLKEYAGIYLDKTYPKNKFLFSVMVILDYKDNTEQILIDSLFRDKIVAYKGNMDYLKKHVSSVLNLNANKAEIYIPVLNKEPKRFLIIVGK